MLRESRGRFTGPGGTTSSGDEVAAELDRLIGDAAIELTLEVESNVREATPVRTGFAAASWTDSVTNPVTEPAADVSDAAARAASGQGEVLAYKLGQGNLYVSNPTDYIEHLNGGSSDQAPADFIERAAEQAQQTVQARHDASEVIL